MGGDVRVDRFQLSWTGTMNGGWLFHSYWLGFRLASEVYRILGRVVFNQSCLGLLLLEEALRIVRQRLSFVQHCLLTQFSPYRFGTGRSFGRTTVCDQGVEELVVVFGVYRLVVLKHALFVVVPVELMVLRGMLLWLLRSAERALQTILVQPVQVHLVLLFDVNYVGLGSIKVKVVEIVFVLSSLAISSHMMNAMVVVMDRTSSVLVIVR